MDDSHIDRNESLATRSYYRMFDLTNRLGRTGGVLAKARKFAEWEEARSALEFHTYRRVLLSAPDRTVTARDPFDGQSPKEYLFFGGNGYLNLSTHPDVVQGAQDALSSWGASACASSIIGGKSALHEETEEKLAHFLGLDASFIFPSGYTANDSTISALARPGDTIFGDTGNHLSIDLPSSALKALSNGRIDYRKLAPDAALGEELSMVEGNKILITDGVFSMDGTVANLSNIEKSCRATNTFLIVDDAHGVGVLGKNGAGTCEYFNIQPDMITGSCAKALGSVGGFAAGTKDAIAFIEGTSTSAIYSTYQNSCALGAISAALDVIAREPERQERLLHNARYLKRQLVEVGATVTDTVSAIVPVLFDGSDQAWFFSYFLHSNQVYTNAIFPPAVNQPRVRFSVCTNHTTDDLDRVVSIVSEGLELYDRNFRRQGRNFVGDEKYS